MKRQNIRRSQHGVKWKPILASLCPCQPFYCPSLRSKQQTVVDIVSRLFLHDPVGQPFDIFSTHQTQISELGTGQQFSHSRRSPDRCWRKGMHCDSCLPHDAPGSRIILRLTRYLCFQKERRTPLSKRPFAEPFCQILRQRGSHEPRLLDISMISNRFS